MPGHIYVCMYVCMYVYMYVCTYVCMCVCIRMFVGEDICGYVGMHVLCIY